MAANEYHNFSTPNGYSSRQYDHALPPLPIPTSRFSSYDPSQAQSPLSPFDSPTHDPHSAHRYQTRQSLANEEAYFGDSQGPNSYTDDIPLRSHAQSQIVGDRTIHADGYPSHEESTLPQKERKIRPSRRRRKKTGLFSGKVPWVVYGLTLIQITVFIAEIVRNSILTKTPIEIHPQVNPMLGPSIYVLINMGARYVPCMRRTPYVQDWNKTHGLDQPLYWPCPRTTTLDPNSSENKCRLSDLCGFSAIADSSVAPNQWYRFILPMFLHAGFIHIAFNMLLQLTLGREMEKTFGSLRFAVVYFSSGIFGFVMGGNFAPSGIASTGASGALFGIIALILLDLLYTWDEQKSPWKELAWIGLEVVISFVLGLLPGLDNFSHIGGFLMGLILGVAILHSPNILRRRLGTESPPYSPVKPTRPSVDDYKVGFRGFVKEPSGFFKGRKPLWWAWWIVRIIALIGVLACFVGLIRNFYKEHPDTCSWCKYLSCLPVKNWCDVGNLTPQNYTTNSGSSRRDLFGIPSSANLQIF